MARLAISLAAFGLAHAALAQAPDPFWDGMNGRAPNPADDSVFIRGANGAYVNVRFTASAPYTLASPVSTLLPLISAGVKTLAAAPAGPAGIGLQSQYYAVAYLGNSGSVAFALVSGTGLVVDEVTSALAYKGSNAYTIGQDVNSVAFGDFNGDGNQDLAVAFDGEGNIQPGGIAILLGKSDGSFGNPVVYASGTPATHFAILDLNHDGILDIATVALNQTATVLLGKGDGSFNPLPSYAVGGSGHAIAIADVNGDGNPDLITGGVTGVLLGNGDGTFHPGTPLPAVASGNLLWAFAAGDLNGDGKMDLVYEDIQNQVVVPMFGNGNGGFQVGQAYMVSAFPDSIVLADYNNDSRLDIINGGGDQRVFSRPNNSFNIDILINNGDGTFQGAPAYFALPNAEAGAGFSLISGMAVGNFGGGSPGILASQAGVLTLIRGGPKGALQTPQAVAYSGPVGAIAAGDFNNDGAADAAVASGSTVAILLSNSSGGLTPEANVSVGGSSPEALATGDFNGDGYLDLAALTPGSLAVLKGDGDGTFQPLATIPAGSTPLTLAAADVNGDKKLDLVFSEAGSNGAAGGVYVALNQGGGAFHSPGIVFPGSFPTFAIGDVNGDGHPDLLATSETGNGETALYYLQGNGDGTFQSPVEIISSQDTDNAVLVQDFNGDGHPDLVIAHQTSNTTFLAGNGDGTFYEITSPTVLRASEQPTFLATADLNGDGKPDLVVGGLTIVELLAKTAPSADVYSAAVPDSRTLAPGSLASAFGTDLANSSPGSSSLPLPTIFGGTTVSVVDASGVTSFAPLLYVATGQVNFEVPAGIATGPAQVVVTSGDGIISTGNVEIQPVAPGLFTFNSGGLAAAYVIVYHPDGTNAFEPVYAVGSGGALIASPVSLGSAGDQAYLFLFGTGFDAARTPTVSVGGSTLPVAYAGPQGGYAGLDQANILLPGSLAGKGKVSIALTVNGLAANAVNITIQ